MNLVRASPLLDELVDDQVHETSEPHLDRVGPRVNGQRVILIKY